MKFNLFFSDFVNVGSVKIKSSIGLVLINSAIRTQISGFISVAMALLKLLR